MFNFAKKVLHSKFYRIYILFPGVCSWAQIDYFFHNKHLSIMLKWLFPLVSQFFTEICWKRQGVIPQSWEIKCRSTLYLHLKKFCRIIILFRLFFVCFSFIMLKHLVIFFQLFCMLAVIILDIYIIFHSQSSTSIYYEYRNT